MNITFVNQISLYKQVFFIMVPFSRFLVCFVGFNNVSQRKIGRLFLLCFYIASWRELPPNILFEKFASLISVTGLERAKNIPGAFDGSLARSFMLTTVTRILRIPICIHIKTNWNKKKRLLCWDDCMLFSWSFLLRKSNLHFERKTIVNKKQRQWMKYS